MIEPDTSGASHPASMAPVHPWLRPIRVAFAPGPITPLLQEFHQDLQRAFRRLGHQLQEIPDDYTDVLLTTARFGEPVSWREALLFTARRRYHLARSPTVITLIDVAPDTLRQHLDRLEAGLSKDAPDPADFDFAGLAPGAYRTLFKQGRRGGPILALERLVQAQAKCLRILLIVGDRHPQEVHHFDLVGAHPCSRAGTSYDLHEDVVLRIVTSVSTEELNHHQVVGEEIPRTRWQQLQTPASLCRAGRQLGERGFFSETVRIADLVAVPAMSEAVASQYSEGCFCTWEPLLEAMIITVTGSARPVDKGSIVEDDLAVVVGVRPDGRGALVRQVEGLRNDPPSSEAVEMFDLDRALPRVTACMPEGSTSSVPVTRSKLHGHRGVAAFRPEHVEYAPVEPAYFHYPVSCGTSAQAQAIKSAFSRARCLQDPEDPRLLAFTILPGHGVVITEKWAPGKGPFEVILEALDQEHLVLDHHVPQGPCEYVPGDDGRMHLQSL